MNKKQNKRLLTREQKIMNIGTLISHSCSVGTTYVRWGRKDCPLLNGTKLVYSGDYIYLL